MSGDGVEPAEPHLDPAMVWEVLLADPALERIRPLLRAAHADERLRVRTPQVSHFALSFAGDDDAAGEVGIVPLSNGRFVVEAAGNAAPADDEQAAVRMAAEVAGR